MFPQLKKTISKYKGKGGVEAPGNITTPFGGSTRDEVVHPGIDFANAAGSKIPAFANGVVTDVRTQPNGFGNTVTLKDGGGNVHQYAHLQGTNVVPGQSVKQGQQIATMGSSGGTSYSPTGGDPSHLDIRIVSAFGKWKNPLTYLNSFKK